MTTSDGLRLAMRGWPGEGEPRLFLAHATGFCKELWGPLMEELRSRGVGVPAVAWDSRGHGDSGVPEPPYDWWAFAEDVLAALEAEPREGRLGLGHSCGGTALAMVEIMRPGTFLGLVLVEPIVFPPPYRRWEDAPLAEGAERRKQSFPSLQEARENFASKEVFSAWDRRAMDAYLTGGLEQRDAAWWLKCPPWAEAEIYRGSTAHGAWERLPEVRVPVLVLAGERSDSHPEPFVRELTGRFPLGRYQIVSGASHFLPMERPGLVAEAVVEALSSTRG